jgi:hypothetical protein
MFVSWTTDVSIDLAESRLEYHRAPAAAQVLRLAQQDRERRWMLVLARASAWRSL